MKTNLAVDLMTEDALWVALRTSISRADSECVGWDSRKRIRWHLAEVAAIVDELQLRGHQLSLFNAAGAGSDRPRRSRTSPRR